MAFKIWGEEFKHEEKFVTVVPGSYGICVCLKTRKDNSCELIKFENLERNKIAKTLADYLTSEDLSLSKIYVKDKVFTIPKDRNSAKIKTEFKTFLESLDEKQEQVITE